MAKGDKRKVVGKFPCRAGCGKMFGTEQTRAMHEKWNTCKPGAAAPPKTPAASTPETQSPTQAPRKSKWDDWSPV